MFMETIILGHCILNVNSRAPGIARWRNVVKPVWDIVKSKQAGFLQLPCPEAVYLGLRRWWFVREQYDNSLFRELCRRIAVGISEILKENNTGKFKLIGLGISPSCGYRETQTDPSWGGRPREVDVKNNIKPGPGVFIEILDDTFRKYGFDYEIYDIPPLVIYPEERAGSSMYPRDFESCVREICGFLEYDCKQLHLNEYEKLVCSDSRGGRILVAPAEAAIKSLGLIERYVEEGYGLILIPSSEILTTEKEMIADVYVKQIENHLDVGHEILLMMYEPSSNLYKKTLEFLKGNGLLGRIKAVTYV
jgi:predicted secreted protein